MVIDLQDHTALVTGGTRGIGAAIVAAFLESGARVIATGRSAEALPALRARMSGRSVRYEAVDFADAAQTQRFADTIAEEPLTVLVNNAGINRLALTEDVNMADWDLVQQINVRAPMQLCRAIAPKMAKRGYGRVVNITSIWSHVTRSKRITYSTSKYALLGMTKTLAIDYASSNVLVNAVAPGFVDTELTRSTLSLEEQRMLTEATPIRRFISEEEIARIVVFLASPVNGCITGQNILADGGYTSV